MIKRIASIVAVCAAVVLTTAPFISKVSGASDGLAVHEWGTFTTVAGTDGRAIEWLPLGGPTDLPCFVHHFSTRITVYKTWPGDTRPFQAPSTPLSYDQARTQLRGKVRMETPVIYFYSDKDVVANVSVGFDRGIITEFYPMGFSAQAVNTRSLDPNQWGSMTWSNVRIGPSVNASYPNGGGESHYYAARATDASPIQIGQQREKFIFYRGVASFDVPIQTRPLADGSMEVWNIGPRTPLPNVILFENRGGKIGYRINGELHRADTIAAPTLNGSLPALRKDLEAMLVKAGLYQKEAAAMVETWRDSWFEEGTRVFYIVPTGAIERILPLRVSGARVSTTRVFVGRMDVVTAGMEDAVERVLTSDSDALPDRFGRLLEPITDRILERTASNELRRAIAASRQDAFRRYATASGKCQ
jgi:hypothetical protein